MNNNQPYWLNENGSYFSNFNAIYVRWQEEIRVKLLYSILKHNVVVLIHYLIYICLM